MSDPTVAMTNRLPPTSPRAVVDGFLAAAVSGHWDEAIALLAEDVAYTNVSLPTIRGRRRVGAVLKALLDHDAVGFEVHTHTCAAEGEVVLTERTDAMTLGRLRVQFWVYGRFEVRDGRIAVWRDSFDWMAVVLAIVRGVLGMAVPRVRARPPVD